MAIAILVGALSALILAFVAWKEFQYQLKSMKAKVRVDRLGWRR